MISYASYFFIYSFFTRNQVKEVSRCLLSKHPYLYKDMPHDHALVSSHYYNYYVDNNMLLAVI